MKINPDFKKVAIQAVKEGGEILMKSFNRVKVIRFKDRQDVCTNLDLEIEKLLVNKIKLKYPNHNIISEERGEENLGSEFTWILDPLDGSKHYFRKMPFFCISVALQRKKEIILGVIFYPATNNLFYAVKNQGAFLNNKKIQVSKEKNLANSFIHAELPNFKLSERAFNDYNRKLEKLLNKSYRVRAFGSGPMGLCYLSSGGFDAHIVLHDSCKFCDIAAGLIIAKEAGAKITDLRGNKLKDKDTHILASNGKIHNQILKIIN